MGVLFIGMAVANMGNYILNVEVKKKAVQLILNSLFSETKLLLILNYFEMDFI